MSRITITFDAPSLTVQSAKSECDVHTILAQYRKTGILPNRSDAYYADVTGALDFASAYNLVLDAQAQFAALPAREREKYGNDVQEWMIASALHAQQADTLQPIADRREAIVAGASPSSDAPSSVAAPAATSQSPESH